MKITERLAKPFGRPHPGIFLGTLKHTPGKPFSSILSKKKEIDRQFPQEREVRV